MAKHRGRRTWETPMWIGAPTRPNALCNTNVQIRMLHGRKTVGMWQSKLRALICWEGLDGGWRQGAPRVMPGQGKNRMIAIWLPGISMNSVDIPSRVIPSR